MCDDDLFTSIEKGIADATHVVLSELWRLIQTPWQWRLYADTQGVPELPASVFDGIKTLRTDDPLLLIQDAATIVEALRDAVMAANAADVAGGTLAEGLEAVLRMFLPIALVSLRRSEHHKAYAIVAAIALADDKLADQAAVHPGSLADCLGDVDRVRHASSSSCAERTSRRDQTSAVETIGSTCSRMATRLGAHARSIRIRPSRERTS